MVDIYDRELVGIDAKIKEKTPISTLVDSINELKVEIENTASPLKIMEIVHTKVHPNLQLTFNLTLKR